MRFMVNGAKVDIRPSAEECDYCGEVGHHWTTHEQARTDAIVWERQYQALVNE